MIVTGRLPPTHVSDMGPWASVISVAMGPYEPGGVMPERGCRYFTAIGAMLVTAVTFLVYFRRRGWT